MILKQRSFLRTFHLFFKLDVPFSLLYVLLLVSDPFLLMTSSRFKVQGSLLFVTYTIIQSIISSEMQVELKKNTA